MHEPVETLRILLDAHIPCQHLRQGSKNETSYSRVSVGLCQLSFRQLLFQPNNSCHKQYSMGAAQAEGGNAEPGSALGARVSHHHPLAPCNSSEAMHCASVFMSGYLSSMQRGSLPIKQVVSDRAWCMAAVCLQPCLIALHARMLTHATLLIRARMLTHATLLTDDSNSRLILSITVLLPLDAQRTAFRLHAEKWNVLNDNRNGGPATGGWTKLRATTAVAVQSLGRAGGSRR